MTDDERRQLEQLWTRYVAREPLTGEERGLLAAALERDEVFRRRMITDLQFDGALRAAGEIERGQDKLVAKVKALVTAAGRTEEVVAAVRQRIEAKAAIRSGVPSRRARSPWAATATVVVLAAAAAMVLMRPRLEPAPPAQPPTAQSEVDPSHHATRESPPPSRAARPGSSAPELAPARVAIARLEALTGPVYRHGADGSRRVAPGVELSSGDWISTSGPGARARLAGPGSSQIELSGEAVAGVTAEAAPTATSAPTDAPAGMRFFLAHGRASAAIPAGKGGALVLASPHAIVTGTGNIRFEVGPSVTRVEVKEGHARVSALGVQRGTDVEAGQLALVSADDLQPPRAQAAAREALLLVGPDDTKEGPPPQEGLRGSEERLKVHLERLGFQVIVADAGTLPIERARAAALLVMSSSVSSQLLPPWYTDMPVPMLVLESTGFEQLGLTGQTWLKDVGPTPALAEITITGAAHPLAAGLSGTLRVLTVPVKLRWGSPTPGATRIATWSGGPEQASLLFGYERGAPMVSGTAPARRVGLFLGNGRVIRALTEPGWRLFEAAASWAVEK
jgi:hypothetical protein